MSPLFREESHIDRETILDITVNVIPIFILAVFFVLYVLYSPWEYDISTMVIQHFLTLFPLLMLAILSYISARIVSRDEDILFGHGQELEDQHDQRPPIEEED